MKIILISGKQGSGKTTLQKNLQIKMNLDLHKKAATVNFADELYVMHNFCVERLKFNGVVQADPKYKDKKLLQVLGTDWARAVYGPEIWVKILQNKIKQFETEGYTHVIIGDCRFESEFDAFPEALRVRLLAPRDVRKARTDTWRDTETHQSEIDLDRYCAEERFDLCFATDIQTVNEICLKIFEALETNWVAVRPVKEYMRK